MYRLLVDLLQPLPLLLLACWLVPRTARWWKPESKLAGRLISLLLLLAWVACTPLAGHLARRTLDGSYDRLEAWPTERQAIVVLCGGVSVTERAAGSETTLTHESIQRAMEARRLYVEHGPMPILVTGGIVDPSREGSTEAACMAAFLESMGVDRADLIEEGRSRTTFENAVYSAEILAESEIESVVLVTHGVHLPRALRCFRGQGVDCLPAPVAETEDNPRVTASWFIPNPSGVEAVHCAAHEWLGFVWYALSGRFDAAP